MSSSTNHIPISELINLTHKRAVVTGGAVGIGFAISYRLAEAGATVVIADVDGEKGKKSSQEITDCGLKAASIQCDVSSEERIQNMVERATREAGGIDILVNNAGIYPRVPLEQMSSTDFEEVISINLTGAFVCSREVSRHMIQQRQGGCIINIASIDSIHPSAKGLCAYDASKGGILALTKSMALELGQYDIRVNAIAPGGILTENTQSAVRSTPTEQGKAELKAFMARTALGRMGRADDIGRVALFLASDLASYMTGSLVVADGGYLIS